MEGCCVILYLLAVHICIHILPVGHHIYWRIVGPSYHFVPAENCHLNWLKYWYFSCISSIWKASTNISIEHHFQGLFPRFFSKINFTNPKTKKSSVCLSVRNPLNDFDETLHALFTHYGMVKSRENISISRNIKKIDFADFSPILFFRRTHLVDFENQTS